MTIAKLYSTYSDDGSARLGFETMDKNMIEAIYIPREGKVKICISSQVGCGFACLHCKTGTVGFLRNLSSEEMFEQARIGLDHAPKGSRPEVIYFGAGEPFLNYDNTISSMEKIYDRLHGFDSYQQIQVSTSGVKSRIIDFANLSITPQLAVSLHSAIKETRRSLIPQSKSFCLSDLKNELRYYADRVGQRIIIHYTLISDFNDDTESIDALTEYLKDLHCIVHVLPFNPYENSIFSRPVDEKGIFFVSELTKNGVSAEYRPSRGRDIGAACGQLVCGLPSKKKRSG